MISVLRRQRGFALVFTALSMTVLILAVGLAVDLGVYFTSRTSAQHAADAGALAGAYTLLNSTIVGQPTSAQTAAVTIANQNKILGAQVAIATSDVNVDLTNRRVTVTVERTAAKSNPIPVYFARIIGINGMDLRTRATAEASYYNASYFTKPIWIPNSALSGLATNSQACDAKQLLVNQNWPYDATAWANGLKGSSTQFELVQEKNPPSPTTIKNGFYTMDLGDYIAQRNDTYVDPKIYDMYACIWKNSPTFCKTAMGHDTYPANGAPACGSDFPGNGYPVVVADTTWTQPTLDGVKGLICGPSGNCALNPPDTWQAPGQYLSGTKVKDVSPQVIKAPIWNNCVTGFSGGVGAPDGNKTAIIGFATIFIDDIVQTGDVATLKFHFIDIVGCGQIANPPSPYAQPIRLVQTPLS
jgi:Flp pilus assembly protein TadG